jgi:hypothetical protein
MKPRGPVMSFATPAALGGIAFALGWKALTGDSTNESTTLGIIFGLALGAVGVAKLTESAVVVPVADKTAFLRALETQLAALDILPATQLENYKLYESKSAGSFSLGPVSVNGIIERVRVQFDDARATLVATKTVLRKLRLTGA